MRTRCEGVQIPVVLSFIDDHSQHLGHSMFHPLNASVTVWVIEACGKLAHSHNKSWYTACESLEQNWRPSSESMVRDHPHRGNVLADQNVGRALSGELGGSDGEDIGSTTELVGDKQDVGVASRRDGKGTEIIDADGDARTFRQRH